MSKLGKFFKGGGSSKSRAAPSPQEALARLRETEEMLSKKQEYLENRIQRELALAKKHGTQNKRAALQALKRKKRFEKQLTQIDGTLSTIEFQREALENSHTNTEVLRNMGFAAKAMKAVHENMDLNKIDDLMQEITEQQDIAQEISEAFSQRAGFGDDFDEDELMAELEELEQEELNKKMTNIHLPNVPSSSLPAQPARMPSRTSGMSSAAHRSRAASSRRAEEEDDDIKQLAAWAT
ncbi:charged multivesicular body protein 4c [Panthera pardus]|uniref:Charged multivesicular body protein 4c n=5 Tax=Felidae TaxID=9681 RepID=A0A6J0A478_ACIJB|nr:charged multivesicular body protein 4c [Panthera tigris]XP_014936171.2 charged multivesicular body protein 4c [Acinonyx jubatus]XP_019308909.1 charged multivesicular body protein 4c [Panthera pardus]XP_030160251.1 charged multivesicular body protein 4c [Lynx canadensis]XP_040343433.1 charged multivesicular body protein 4c [Puma yagouaroundi]XP_042780163.1 charged multivesicular body protein 4c [Panthera leo]XP_045310699.1 charged multivesicular body protein 4c [Leopardus geoffroyi]XP_0469